MTNQEGSTKKFLYNAPTKARAQEEDKEWNFTYNKKKEATTGQPVVLDDVWSIMKNVEVGKNSTNDTTDKLSFNADTKFYSRHNNLQGRTCQPIATNIAEGVQIQAKQKAFTNQRRNSNTRRHSLTPEDDFDF